MRRRKPMNRGNGLRRRAPLKKTRGPRRSPMWNPNREDAAAFQAAVLDASRGLDVVTGEPAVDAHHIIPKRAIRRYVSARVRDGTVSKEAAPKLLRRLLWDRRNGLAVSRKTHDEHETRRRPIPRRYLPGSAIAFAQELGLVWMIERDYPKED